VPTLGVTLGCGAFNNDFGASFAWGAAFSGVLGSGAGAITGGMLIGTGATFVVGFRTGTDGTLKLGVVTVTDGTVSEGVMLSALLATGVASAMRIGADAATCAMTERPCTPAPRTFVQQTVLELYPHSYVVMRSP
jgi:hypothetical protein